MNTCNSHCVYCSLLLHSQALQVLPVALQMTRGRADGPPVATNTNFKHLSRAKSPAETSCMHTYLFLIVIPIKLCKCQIRSFKLPWVAGRPPLGSLLALGHGCGLQDAPFVCQWPSGWTNSTVDLTVRSSYPFPSLFPGLWTLVGMLFIAYLSIYKH